MERLDAAQSGVSQAAFYNHGTFVYLFVLLPEIVRAEWIVAMNDTLEMQIMSYCLIYSFVVFRYPRPFHRALNFCCQ